MIAFREKRESMEPTEKTAEQLALDQSTSGRIKSAIAGMKRVPADIIDARARSVAITHMETALLWWAKACDGPPES